MRFPVHLGLPTLLIVLASPSPAYAEDLGNGMIYDVNTPGYHVVVANNDSDGTEVRVTLPNNSPTGDMITTYQHAYAEGATVAINANYFGGGPNYPCGLGRGFGVTYNDGYSEAVNCETSLMWARAQGGVIDSFGHEHDPAFMPQFTDVATGGGYLVQNGAAHDWNHAKLEEGRDCSAVGITADRKHIILIVTDSTACTGVGLQQAMLAHGAADAIHLDGGGSSKMWIRGKGYVNDEIEDRAPPVVIFARPNGACPSDCGSARCVDMDRPWRAQCVGQACRAGLTGIWTCDTPKLRRIKCDANGNVISEYCAQGCNPQPINVDDLCNGGAIPEPVPDAGAGDAGSGGDGGTKADAGGAKDGGSAGGSGTIGHDGGPLGDGGGAMDTPPSDAGSSGGCGCGIASRAGFPAIGALGALIAGLAARRRRRLPRA